MDLKALQSTLEQLEAEKGISKEKIIETIEDALAAAYKKDYGKRGQIIKAKFNYETGGTDFSQIKVVVDESMIKPEEPEEDNEENTEGIVTDISDKKTDKEDEDTIEYDENGEEIRKIRFNPERHIMLSEAQKIKKSVQPND